MLKIILCVEGWEIWLEGEYDFISVRLEMSWTLKLLATEPGEENSKGEGDIEYGLEVVE